MKTLSGAKARRGRYRSDQERWNAVINRDGNADGEFFYSVKTTGVYCRPSCAARQPRRENVQFHASCEEAQAAGFRPCKRCQPEGASLAELHARMVGEACEILQKESPAPDLETLSRAVGMSRFHFHRIFTSIVGLTPKAYSRAARAERARTELHKRKTVTDAIYGAGFNSNGRFYAESTQMLGMAPKRFLKGGDGTTIRFAVGESSLGSILVAASEKGVCAIFLGDDPKKLVQQIQEAFPAAKLIGGDKSFERVIAKVVGFVETPQRGLNLPLDVRGTVFQQRVWQALREIPVGSTASYTEIAKRIGSPKSVRAVAAACAANTIAVAIPCHRVVRTDGNLSGYRWGVERKRALLKRERTNDADES